MDSFRTSHWQTIGRSRPKTSNRPALPPPRGIGASWSSLQGNWRSERQDIRAARSAPIGIATQIAVAIEYENRIVPVLGSCRRNVRRNDPGAAERAPGTQEPAPSEEPPAVVPGARRREPAERSASTESQVLPTAQPGRDHGNESCETHHRNDASSGSPS